MYERNIFIDIISNSKVIISTRKLYYILYIWMELFRGKNSKNSLPEKSKKITSIRIERIIFLTSFPPISFKSVVISRFHYSFPCYLHNFPLYIMDYHTFILHIRLVIAIQTVSSNGRSEDFLASRIFA